MTMTRSQPELRILALNCGSSSLKFGLYRVDASRFALLISGEAESIGENDGRLRARDAQGEVLRSAAAPIASHGDAVLAIAELLADAGLRPDAVGHRVVHGGPKLRRHCRIDDTVLAELATAAAFAPLHTPPALAVIRFTRQHFSALPQVACFDTTFHADLPDVARLLPIARQLQDGGIQRYGFHGLSCESIVRQLADELPERLVIAHLGNGSSITAVKRGRSIDTSMGLTPSGGVPMGTRSGDLDPGVLIYLLREKQFDAAKLEDLIDRRSGLLGISGISGDLRRLHAAAPASAEARLAIEMFCYAVRKAIAAMIAALGGIDRLVFTGGIGENDAQVRAAIADGLGFAGVGAGTVSVLPSQEDDEIARHSFALTSPAAHRMA